MSSRARTSRRFRAVLAIAVGAALLGACGDDDGGSDAGGSGIVVPADQGSSGGGGSGSSDDADTWPPADARGSGAGGAVTVDANTYQIDAVRECDVTDYFVGDFREPVYRMEGTGVIDPDDEWSDEVYVHMYLGRITNPDQDHQEIRYTGPEGRLERSANGVEVWSSGATNIGDAPFDFDGDRITGEIATSSGGNPPIIGVDLARPTGGPVDCD